MVGDQNSTSVEGEAGQPGLSAAPALLLLAPPPLLVGPRAPTFDQGKFHKVKTEIGYLPWPLQTRALRLQSCYLAVLLSCKGTTSPSFTLFLKRLTDKTASC